MREAGVKMKFEDAEDTQAQLTAENRQLKEQISRQFNVKIMKSRKKMQQNT